jgi:predicted Fe-Mo cluster-binding NifX family protein
MTKIAIPLFNERVSPRFDCAQSFLLVETEDRRIVESEEVRTGQLSTMERVGKLSDLRVDALICGGIDEVSARRLVHKGIRIYAWITGMARDALISFLNGDLESGIMVGAGGHRQGRWRLKGKGPHRGEGRGKPGAGRGRGGGGGRGRNT